GARLAKHGRLCLNPTDAPADDAQSINHRGMGVGPNQGVWVKSSPRKHHDLREILEIHLMTNSCARRDDAKILKSLLTPTKKNIALAIAFVFNIGVEGEGRRRRELIDLDGVVDHKIHRYQRIDFVGVSFKLFHGVAHSSQVHDGGNSSK